MKYYLKRIISNLICVEMNFNNLKKGEKFAVLTAYDATSASFLEQAGIDLIFVGDSLANTVLGYKDTKSISLEEMLHHCRAVARGATKTPIVGDMPINTYNNPSLAVINAKKFLGAGAHAVKIEGTKIEVVEALREKGIEVMGHIGLTPQTAEQYKVQGKNGEDAESLKEEAKALEKAGCFSLVLECIPSSLGKQITELVKIPTIGIGAGKFCDGQVLVLNDILGLTDGNLKPKFVKQYADLGNEMKKAVEKFKEEVKSGEFPSEENSYS